MLFSHSISRTIFIFILALVGVFYPYNRGALFTALVVIYALTSGIAGYTAASFYCLLEGTNWVCFHGSNACPFHLNRYSFLVNSYDYLSTLGHAKMFDTASFNFREFNFIKLFNFQSLIWWFSYQTNFSTITLILFTNIIERQLTPSPLCRQIPS